MAHLRQTGLHAPFLVTGGYFSVGDLLLLLLYGQGILSRSSQTQLGFTKAVEDLSEAAPMVRILSQEAEIRDDSPRPLIISRGQIEISKVSFAYPGGKPLFQDFSLNIAAEEKVGLVGPSGAGKSTLFRMLLRMIEPNRGRVLFDGQDIALFHADSLRRQISYVTQEPILFHRSLAENISYGQEAPIEEIEAAAQRAHADHFIESLPEGYHSVVGDRGVKLSGGERQRILLARVFLRSAPVLLLDEPTASLDSGSEEMIQRSTEELFQGRTALVIAHRLSTIAHLDRIVVLDHGKIVEEGRHSELLSAAGLYADLWHKQSEGFLP